MTINLELQLKFLQQLEQALGDAIERHGTSAEKEEELSYMRREVERAKGMIAERIDDKNERNQPVAARNRYQEAASL